MEVRLCQEGPERLLVEEFCRRVFDAAPEQPQNGAQTPADLSLRNPYDSGPVPTAIAIDGGAIIGHVTSTPFALWIDGRERPAFWLSGIHVLPEYRGMGIARKLAACITAATPLVTGVARVEPSIKSFIAAGWVWPGKIVDYVHIVNPGRFLAQMSGDRLDRFVPARLKFASDFGLRLLRLPMSGSVRVWQSMKRIRSRAAHGSKLAIQDVDRFSPALDALWERERTNFTMTHVRRADYLNWQFATHKGWGKAEYLGADGMKACAIYAVKEYADGGQLNGLKALNVVDALWQSHDLSSLSDLIDYFLHRGYSDGADLIMFSGDHPQLRSALARAAFIKIPPTIFAGFGSHDKTDNFQQLFPGSYITRGYADAAGGLGPG